MLTSSDDVFYKSSLELTKQLKAASVEVLTPAPFTPSEFQAVMLNQIKRTGIRILCLLAYGEDMDTVASSARHAGMTSAGYAWINPELFPLANADGQGWIYLVPFLPSEGMQAFADQVSDYTRSGFAFDLSPDAVDIEFSVLLHESIVLYARAATKVMLGGGDFHDGKAVVAAIRSSTFVGVGGRTVALDSSGDRIESYEVMNYVVEADDQMNSVPVGTYDSSEQQYTAYERAVVWPGSTIEVPVDYFSGTPTNAR